MGVSALGPGEHGERAGMLGVPNARSGPRRRDARRRRSSGCNGGAGYGGRGGERARGECGRAHQERVEEGSRLGGGSATREFDGDVAAAPEGNGGVVVAAGLHGSIPCARRRGRRRGTRRTGLRGSGRLLAAAVHHGGEAALGWIFPRREQREEEGRRGQVRSRMCGGGGGGPFRARAGRGEGGGG